MKKPLASHEIWESELNSEVIFGMLWRGGGGSGRR